MRTEEMHELWMRVQENAERLRKCAGHEFSVDLSPDTVISKKWACRHCRGEVSSVHKYWYEQGREHEKQDQKAPTDGCGEEAEDDSAESNESG